MARDSAAQTRFDFGASHPGRSGAARVSGAGGSAGLPVLTAPGPLAAERALLDVVGQALARRAGALLQPIRIVVPSQRLRQQVSSALLRRHGSALLGVAVQTLRALALETLERAGEAPPLGDALIPVLVRRHAKREPRLESLIALEDGTAVVHASVRDFLDAGLESASHAEAVDECLAELGAEAGVDRARAVARVAARVQTELRDLGLGHGAALLAQARDLLLDRGPSLLPTASMWIHGFADATGLAAEWLEALVRVVGAGAIVSVPPDPLGAAGQGSPFAQPLIARLGGLSGVEQVDAPEAGAQLDGWTAAGEAAELRCVALRVRKLLDAGVEHERIGVVARRLEPYRNALHAQFTRLGIPYSALGCEGPGDLTARRGRALVALLHRGEGVESDRWLDAHAQMESVHPDLRVALHVLGASRLGSFAALDLEVALGGRQVLTLPMRGGEQEDDEGRRGRLSRRRIARAALARAQSNARETLTALEQWPLQSRFGDHRAAMDRLTRSLGWTDDDPGAARAAAALARLVDDVPAAFELDREEMALLVERAWNRVSSSTLGGRGAGVQVASVMEARGNTFEHLFVIGLNRDVFPRPLTEDALVPDRLRSALRRNVLPELPVKARGREEERHLFADLLASSPRVDLSCQHATEDGRERTASPFLVRLGLEYEALEKPRAADASAGPLALHEAAILAGVSGWDGASIRSDALAEARRRLGNDCTCDAAQLASLQRAVLDEIEPRPGPGRTRLGPYWGFILPSGSPDDERLYVTRLEALARCGWQAFLRKSLGLEPMPDALGALPALSPLLHGNAVHGVLERIVSETLPERRRDLAEALEAGPVEVAWPDERTLETWVQEEAARAAAEEGIRSGAFIRALAARVRGDVERARSLAWPDGDAARVFGVELQGTVLISRDEGAPRPLHFRVDAVDAGPGGVQLTDYKTGNPISLAKTPKTRAKHFAAAMERGESLQAAAYVQGALQLTGIERASGRFLFLGASTPETSRHFEVAGEDADLAAAFQLAASTALDAFAAGVRPPRLTEVGKDAEPRSCQYCEVSEACSRGDSGARARLRDWLAHRAEDPPKPGAEDAYYRLYTLGRTGRADR